MMQQYLKWSVNSNFCRRRKTRVLGVEILASGTRAEKNKYPNILEIPLLQARPRWLLIRSLKLIFRYKDQVVSSSARSNYISLDKIVGSNHYDSRRSFRNNFLILILLNIILRQCFKGCTIFQRAWRLV